MPENNLQKPLTLEDLGKYTEEVLLPAIGTMIEEKLEKKFEEKLNPVWQELRAIRQDLKRLEDKVDRIAKAASEDVVAVNADVEKLKERVIRLEEQIKVLQTK